MTTRPPQPAHSADDTPDRKDPAAGTPQETPSGPFAPPPMPDVLRELEAADNPPRRRGPIPQTSAVHSGRVFAIGMDFVYSVGGCALLGWGIDWWQKTTPLWLLIGAGIGIAVAMYRFIREGLKLSRGSGRGDPGPNGKSK